jgi:hypothetical protein
MGNGEGEQGFMGGAEETLCGELREFGGLLTLTRICDYRILFFLFFFTGK